MTTNLFYSYIHPLMKKTLPLFFIALLLQAANTQSAVIDRVVAEVNDDIITLSELNEEGKVFLKQIAAEVPADKLDATFKQALGDILNGLIDKSMISQAAAKRNITVSDAEIDGAIARITAANNISQEGLYQELQAKGLDISTYRNNLQSQLLQNKLITREVSSKIVITEDMILDFYDTEYTEHVEEGGYYLLQIGISWGASEASKKSTVALYEDKMTAKKTADRVYKLAVSGQDFNDLARKFSNLPSAADGGDIGVFEINDMASYMKTAVTQLKPGEISPIVETPSGYQFFKLLSNMEGGIVMQAPYESVKEEIREQLFKKAMETEFKTWIRDLKENAYIKKML